MRRTCPADFAQCSTAGPRAGDIDRVALAPIVHLSWHPSGSRRVGSSSFADSWTYWLPFRACNRLVRSEVERSGGCVARSIHTCSLPDKWAPSDSLVGRMAQAVGPIGCVPDLPIEDGAPLYGKAPTERAWDAKASGSFHCLSGTKSAYLTAVVSQIRPWRHCALRRSGDRLHGCVAARSMRCFGETTRFHHDAGQCSRFIA